MSHYNVLHDFLKRLIARCIRAHRVYSHWIRELIASIPSVKLLVVMIVAESSCCVEGICEDNFLVEKLSGVQVESESNFCAGSGC